MALIQRVAVQAVKTFAKNTPKVQFPDHLRNLVSLVNQVTSPDLGFDSRVVPDNEEYKPGITAPIVYIPIWEDSVFSMGIFVIRRGAAIPLHDHPNMHGVIKVIHGKIRLRSYTRLPETVLSESLRRQLDLKLKPWQRPHVFPARREPTCMASSDSDPCVLTPAKANLHELIAVDGPAAFLDILAPPYDHDTGLPGSRQCHYYQLFAVDDGSSKIAAEGQPEENGRVDLLMRVQQPRDFWGDSGNYEGPHIDPHKEVR